MFPKPTQLNDEGWAILAELNVGDHAPLAASNEEGAPPTVKLVFWDDEEIRFKVVDPARHQNEELEINSMLGSSDHTHVRGELVEFKYLGAANEAGAAMLLIRAEDATGTEDDSASRPTLEGAKRLLHFRTYDKLNELTTTNAAN